VNLDINVTSTCNLGCKYCSEGHNPDMPDLAKIENSKTDVKTLDIINFISKIRKEKPEEAIHISFWGGEPFMNFQYCYDLMKFYKNNEKVDFFFYTNGTYIKKYREKLKEINDLIGKRLVIQISYDGEAVNDVERLTKKNTSTTHVVKEAFKVLGELGIERVIKSTISPRTLPLIYEAYLDVISIPGNHNYFPTPDSYSDYILDPEHEAEILSGLKDGLMKIAKHIYDNKLPLNKFGWFQNSRALCSAGINYFSVNLDGAISPCHGTMYEDHAQHEIGNLYNTNIVDILDESTVKYKELISHMNDDCVGCKSYFCMKCPAGSFNLESTKEVAFSKDLDKYDAQWSTKNINLCKIFKLNDIIHKSLLKAMDAEPIQAEKKACEVRF